MTWPHELGHSTNRGVVGLDGQVVMRRDFRFRVNGFATDSVLQAKYFQTGLSRRSEQTDAQPGTAEELLAQLREIICNRASMLHPVKLRGYDETYRHKRR